MFDQFSIDGIDIIISRDDLNHWALSGNKLHKLKPSIDSAIARRCHTVVSFGGPYSNHLHALAWACKRAGLSSVGIVRGELHSNLTPTLYDCREWGMQLLPSERSAYRGFREVLSDYSESCLLSEVEFPAFTKEPTNTLVVPEGGSSASAITSLRDAYKKVVDSPECKRVTHAVCATGTGATLAGLSLACPEHIEVIGVQAVSEGNATSSRVANWIGPKAHRIKFEHGHLGGFGKIPAELLAFIAKFESDFGIPLDPVYNAKAMFKLYELIGLSYFKSGDCVLYIHTGGLQGKRGVN